MPVDFANPDADQQHVMAEMNAGFQRKCDECDRVCWDEEDGSCDKLAAKDEEIRNANERATEWEGIATGRRAEAERIDALLERQINLRSGDNEFHMHRRARMAEDLDIATARIALLEKTIRCIEHVDKTPFYGYSGTKADRDRYGHLPKKSGQRWKSPREMVKDLNLPEE